jgi:hypothetical protein
LLPRELRRCLLVLLFPVLLLRVRVAMASMG